jgi:hypothetical protein
MYLPRIKRLEEERATLRNKSEQTTRDRERIKIITKDLCDLWEQRRLEMSHCTLGAERSVTGYRQTPT